MKSHQPRRRNPSSTSDEQMQQGDCAAIAEKGHDGHVLRDGDGNCDVTYVIAAEIAEMAKMAEICGKSGNAGRIVIIYIYILLHLYSCMLLINSCTLRILIHALWFILIVR